VTTKQQHSDVRPTRQANMVAANFSFFICGVCGMGKVWVTGNHDWREAIEAECDNPKCGDPGNKDHGATYLVTLHPDGSLNEYHRTGMPKQSAVNDTSLRPHDPFDGPLLADIAAAKAAEATAYKDEYEHSAPAPLRAEAKVKAH
jgi:hypothetical protein